MKRYLKKLTATTLSVALTFSLISTATATVTNGTEETTNAINIRSLPVDEAEMAKAQTFGEGIVYEETSDMQIYSGTRLIKQPSLTEEDLEAARAALNKSRIARSAPDVRSLGETRPFTVNVIEPPLEKRINLKLVAQNNYCYVYVDPAALTYATGFDVDGAAANAVASSYQTDVYAKLLDKSKSTYLGEPANTENNGKLTILLYDIDNDGSKSSGGMIGGYFYSGDLQPVGTGGDNYGDIIHVDLGEKQGHANYIEKGPTSLTGTIAHELQHLVNFSYYYKAAMDGNTEANIDDIWLDESLSGLADFIYRDEKSMEATHASNFFENEYGTGGISYVPTDEKWEESYSSYNNLLAHYGAASYMAQMYWENSAQEKQPIHALVADPRGGKEGSKVSFGEKYAAYSNKATNNSSFDLFFSDFAAYMATSTRMWTERMNHATHNAVNATINTASTLNTDLSYRPDLKLFKLSGRNAVDITITDENTYTTGQAKNDYYIVFAKNKGTANSPDTFVSTVKEYQELIPGQPYTFEDSIDAHFAILGVGHEKALNSSINMAVATQNEVTKEPIVTVNSASPAANKWTKESPITLNMEFNANVTGADITEAWYKVSDDDTDPAKTDTPPTDSGWTKFDLTGNPPLVIDDEGKNYIQWYAKSDAKSDDKNATIGVGVLGPYLIDITLPTITTPLKAEVLSEYSIKLSADATDALSGIGSYKWEQILSNGGVKPLDSTKDFTIDGLAPATEYTFRFTATDKALNAVSENIKATTNSAPPSVTVKSQSEAMNTWTNQNINLEIGYAANAVDAKVEEVYYKISSDSTKPSLNESPDNTWTHVTGSAVTSSTSITIDAEGENYIKWYVQSDSATNPVGVGVLGPYLIDKVAPEINNPTATAQSSNSVNLAASATDVGSGIATYKWEEILADGNTREVITSSTSGNFTDTGRAAQTEYTYKFTATDNAKNVTSSAAIQVTTLAASVIPSGGGLSTSSSGGSSGSKLPINTPPTSNGATNSTESKVTSDTVDKAISNNNATVRLTIPRGQKSINLSEQTIDKIIANNKPLVVTKDGASIEFSPRALEDAGLVGLGDVVISIDTLIETAIKALIDSLKGGNTDLNKLLLEKTIDVTVTVNKKVVTSFRTPLKLSFDLSKFDIPKDLIEKLSIVYIKSNTSKQNIGGEYNSNTKIIVGEISHLSRFSVMVVDDLSKISVVIGSKTFTVNGATTSFDTAPVIVDGRTMVPVRFFAEAYGADVSWDKNSQTATVKLDGETLRIKIGQLNSGMDVPAQIINDRTMVPMRYIAESFGANLTYNGTTKTIKAYR